MEKKISRLVSKLQSKESFQIFVVFSEYLNFKTYYRLQAKMKVWFIGPSSEPNIIISTILHPSLCISNGNLNLMNYYQFTRCGKSRWEFRDFEMSNHWLCFDNLIRRERNRRSCYKLKSNFFEYVFLLFCPPFFSCKNLPSGYSVVKQENGRMKEKILTLKNLALLSYILPFKHWF